MTFSPNSLTDEEKIGQLLFIGIPGPELDPDTEKLIREIKPGGVCLFARNIRDLRQTRTLLDDIRNSISIEPLLSLDQEGGRVDRLRRVLTPMPSASKLRDAEGARTLGEIIGEALSILGFNMDFAPVVDVIDPSRENLVNGLQTRGFGRSKDEAANMAAAFIDGLDENGIVSCLKHFPGLAAATVDSHEELPVVLLPEDELRNIDLYPYQKLLSHPNTAVMIAHAAYPNNDLQETDTNGNLLPSSLSPNFVTTLLRDELKFSGVAVTDDMEMGAIVRNYGMGEAAKLAVKAGEDMIAICASRDAILEAREALKAAFNSDQVTSARVDEALGRIAKLKSQTTASPKFDSDRLREIDDRIQKLNQHLN